jgi:predicted NUDIX family NTP pyrophosphohydrolase
MPAAKQSAGLLMYRRGARGLELLLVHPGGPYWRGKDAGAWSLPKGEFGDDEEPLAAACREFEEETGVAPAGPYLALSPVRQKSGKRVHAWAFAGDCAPERLRSNTFTMEWPPRSGRFAEFPEVDAAAFFTPAEARTKINPAQAVWIDELERRLATSG